MKKTWLRLTFLMFVSAGCNPEPGLQVTSSPYDLQFPALATTWDEGIPLGNAVVGALVWQRDSCLRLSLDRNDLWDLRPLPNLSGDRYRFRWVYEQVLKNDYLPVQQQFDQPYDVAPAPSKIPGAALEFPLGAVGAPSGVRLYLNQAVCEITWPEGMKMQTFVHAGEPVGWFRIENAGPNFRPELIAPVYACESAGENPGPVAGQDLRRLGYPQGQIVREENGITYRQPGWKGFFYEVAIRWKKKGNDWVGAWSITSSLSGGQAAASAEAALRRGINADYRTHRTWWDSFWSQSSVSLPDTLLARQYAAELYKFGSAAREYTYPVSLQSVWTADNGRLPPWKGDYHHDLNTQLSYWPCYTGNHLTEGLGYLNTLWSQRETNRDYTRRYFETNGLNVPGVCTLLGEPMGGWIQYAMSPTVSAWLSQHFYLHYRYSGDRTFLQEKAYPYLHETATFLEHFSRPDSSGYRRFPLSSSPEINDNSLHAWFRQMTNYDLALARFALGAAAELAGESGRNDEAAHWEKIRNEFPDFDLDETGGLTFAPGHPYNRSHRHFSHAMAIHPLGLIDWSHGEKDRRIIRATLDNLDRYGPDYWCGYSYSWLGNLKARARDGVGAAEALRTFASCFCLKNTFHANGDQSRSGKSRFTYRPFTLEGNFAFAAGIQEMLIQSHTGTIRVFPAVPAAWKEVAFDRLRTYGAFLVSAERHEGRTVRIEVRSEKGGRLRLEYPFGAAETYRVSGHTHPVERKGDLLEVQTEPGETLVFTPEE